MTPYEQGKNAGLKGNTSERGLIRFGLSCAADHETTINTQEWLRGFEAGYNQHFGIINEKTNFIQTYDEHREQKLSEMIRETESKIDDLRKQYFEATGKEYRKD